LAKVLGNSQTARGPIKLGVNIDHVATLRQARRGAEPDPVWAAAAAELAGADGITVHLREDRRHIQPRDVRLLRQTVRGKLNLEMAIAEEVLATALEVKPDQATLVPEKRQEVTTEGGLEVKLAGPELRQAIARLAGAGIQVNLFINPDVEQIEAAKRAGAAGVELHTGQYSLARGGEVEERLAELQRAATVASNLGLFVAAGHGLDYLNVLRVAGIRQVEELNIGHSIVSRAVFAGLGPAVREMKALMTSARNGPAAGR
jgi:pyridoxine 5-phosphate synthase